MRILLPVSIAALLTLSGCASNDSSTKTVKETDNFKSIPEWVLNPTVENGIAAADCVVFSGNLSVDQKLAIANARSALAQQIQTKVEAMDKTYARRSDTTGAMETGSTFESVSKQITSETLTGSQATRFGVANIKDIEYYCAMVTVDSEKSKALFDQLLTSSNRNINNDEESFLYEEFKAHKAQENLEKELERLTD